ncbi:hypothetical protein PV328_001190 [Microctonus aethiopoides]|uniref:Exonuclease domain-containing protein n=1 Tax=Microctonus aethiopoides TaxID=144406 RepID=A0AA39FWX7_9HYME|nr:hypothetical protein PV328_001190 [Microctonus aethiopoides]
MSILTGLYDDHSACDDWCKYKLDPENYKHKILPGGKGLTNIIIQDKLKAIFHSFANVADKLSPCASSQANDSLNNTIATTAPEHLHYGGSSSNDFRVCAGIIHKNLGNISIDVINKKMDSSPTKFSIKYRLKKDEVASRRKLKHRRSNLKNSGCGLDIGIDFVDIITMNPKVDLSSPVVVYFDLETTGLDASKEVVQIAAKYSEVEFNIYIKPEREFSSQASKFTGLHLKDNNLFYKCNLLISHSKLDAAKSFLQFLESINNTIILIAHNCFKFDCPALLDFLRNEGLLNEFSKLVAGFADSLPLLKLKLKNKLGAKVSYRQEVLAEEFLDSHLLSNAHNAANDVDVLQKLIEHNPIDIKVKDIMENFKSVHEIMMEKAEKIKCNEIQKSLQLLLCFESNGLKGIRILLAQDVGGKPRITKSQKIIDTLCNKLKHILSDS